MKAKIYRNIAGAQVAGKAPPAIRGQVVLRGFEREREPITLLVFPSQRKDTVLSGQVQHILREVSLSDRLVAFGGCFTLEALALLRERKAEVFAQSEFPWTDAGWANIRVSIASPVKFPPR